MGSMASQRGKVADGGQGVVGIASQGVRCCPQYQILIVVGVGYYYCYGLIVGGPWQRCENCGLCDDEVCFEQKTFGLRCVFHGPAAHRSPQMHSRSPPGWCNHAL